MTETAQSEITQLETVEPETTQPEASEPETAGPLAELTDAGLEAMLRRALYITLAIGLVGALAVWKASGWRDGAMLAAGALISASSISEWRRLIRLINAKLDRKQAPRGAVLAIVFFLFRLVIFAAVIYLSLKCFHGSVLALCGGLGLAVLALVWEALRLLRN